MEREEAIKVIKNNWPDSSFTMLREALEALIPELKEESEDERIRKELLQIAKDSEDSFYMVMTPNKRERLIAWLEKQGNHQKFRDSIQVGDSVTRNEDGVLVNLSQLNRVAKPAYTKKDLADAYLKGLEDAKSTESNEDPCKNCDQRAMNCQNFPCDRKKAFEQKPAEWSEVDKRKIETIIGHLERQKNYQMNTTNIEQCQDWLKSLKDRIQPQPKQE